MYWRAGWAALLLASQAMGAAADAGQCGGELEIEGGYRCSGECVVTDAAGKHSLTQVSGEEDRIRRFQGAKWMYQIDIAGGGGFVEREIGGLSGNVLQTVTAHVSDQQYPVLEEYVFALDAGCRARSYRKTVRNPDPVAMKACSLACQR